MSKIAQRAPTLGQVAYAAFHGLTLPIAPEDWPLGDRQVVKWEAVGAAVARAAGPFSGITPAQSERLALLVEESGELLQAVGKTMRHGFESRNPFGGAGSPTNRQQMERECGDLRHVMDRAIAAGDLDGQAVAASTASKPGRMRPYLHHQG